MMMVVMIMMVVVTVMMMRHSAETRRLNELTHRCCRRSCLVAAPLPHTHTPHHQ